MLNTLKDEVEHTLQEFTKFPVTHVMLNTLENIMESNYPNFNKEALKQNFRYSFTLMMTTVLDCRKLGL